MVRGSLFVASLFVCLVAPAAYSEVADLSVSVSAPAFVIANYDTAVPTATFSITNAGPATVTDATVDFSPAMTVDLPGFTCATVTDHVHCTIASFPPSTVKGSGSMQVQNATDGTIVTISATVSSATVFDPNHSNNTSTAYERIKWQSNISLTRTDFPSALTVDKGQYGSARVYYEANGPTYATDVQITIQFTGTINPLSVSDPAFTCASTNPSRNAISCTAKKLEPVVSSGFIEFSYAFYAGLGQTVFLNASMTCSDAVTPPLPLVAGLRVVEPAFIMVTSVDTPQSVQSGATFATNVTVRNTGPGAAVQATVEFSVTGTAFGFGLPTAPGWGCDSTSTTVTCSINSFPVGDATFSFPIVLPPDVQPGLLAQAVVANSVTDGYPPWRRYVTTWIEPEKLPAFKATVEGPATVYLGSTATYTITVTNTSVNEATDPVLELSMGSSSPVTWNCPDPRGAQRCGLGDMPAGASRTILATVPVAVDPNSSPTAWAMFVQAFITSGTPGLPYYYAPDAPPTFMKSAVLPGPPKRRSVGH